jgi:hypothetical protein
MRVLVDQWLMTDIQTYHIRKLPAVSCWGETSLRDVPAGEG